MPDSLKARLHLSESPYGPSPAAVRAYLAHASLLSVYPDPSRSAVTRAIADHFGLMPEQVLVANGSDELVLLTALALGDPARPGVVTRGTFPGYRICLEQVGRGAIEVDCDRGQPALDAFVAALSSGGIGYLCHPHNPSGRPLSREELDALVLGADDAGTPLIIDQAYLEFAPANTPSAFDYVRSGAQVLALGTFSKAWGLAALRIGYIVGDPDLLHAVRIAQNTMPFSSNPVGHAAVLGALTEPDFLAEVQARNDARMAEFRRRLDERGIEYLDSATSFVAVEVADSGVAERRLAEQGVLTRDAGAFGMPGYLRVSMGSEEAIDRFFAEFDRLGLAGH